MQSRDWYERARAAEARELIVEVQRREQRERNHKAYRRGRSGVLLAQSRRQPAVQNPLTGGADQPADEEGEGHVLAERGFFLHAAHIILIFLRVMFTAHHVLSGRSLPRRMKNMPAALPSGRKNAIIEEPTTGKQVIL